MSDISFHLTPAALVHAFALTGDTDAVARLLGVDDTDAARVVAHCQEMEDR